MRGQQLRREGPIGQREDDISKSPADIDRETGAAGSRHHTRPLLGSPCALVSRQIAAPITIHCRKRRVLLTIMHSLQCLEMVGPGTSSTKPLTINLCVDNWSLCRF